MFSVALTGGIGSGKSTVAEILEELGALVIDSDALSREVIERGSDGFDQVLARFGDSILKDGEIDRVALGAIVFAEEKARKDLESIIHPLVRERAERIAARAGEGRVVVNQIM
jgi:dephospho-CoA kinase